MSETWESIRPEQIRAGDQVRITGLVKSGSFTVAPGSVSYGPTAKFERLVPDLPTEDGFYLGVRDGAVFRLDDGIWDDGWGNPQTESAVRPYLPLRRLRVDE